MKKRQPMQPLYKDEQGVIRFQSNTIILFLFRCGKLDLNELACYDFPDEDRQQIAQLLGYSLSGYGELSYVTNKAYEKAEKEAGKL